MNDPLVSVIIPVYNAERWLARCLDSVISQSYPTIEILVISDGSTDASDAIIQDFQARDPRVRFIRQDNLGVSAARNQGLAQAQGDWVCFVDADDYVSPHYVQTMLDGLGSEEVDAVAVNFFLETPRGWRLPYPFVPVRKKLTGSGAVRQSFRVLFFPTFVWNKLFRRSLFTDHAIRFPAIIYEDAYLVPLLFLHCRKVVSSKQPRYHYVRRPSSLTHGLTARHVRDYLTAANLLRHDFFTKDLWDQWEKAYGHWLNRIMIQIVLTLYVSKRTMPWKERRLLVSRARMAARAIRGKPGPDEDPRVLPVAI